MIECPRHMMMMGLGFRVVVEAMISVTDRVG